MNKQYGYLYGTFGVLLVIGVVLFSLSYCGGKTDAQMDSGKSEFNELKSRNEYLEKRLKEVEDKEKASTELATKYKFDFELKSYSYDSLRKAKIVIPTRNTNVSDDSLTRIWAIQIR